MTNLGLFLFLMQQTEAQEMTPAGWAFLATAWVAIIIVTVWTFSKILGGK